MILACCIHCNYTARYSSDYFSLEELKKNLNNTEQFPQDDQQVCRHQFDFIEEKNIATLVSGGQSEIE